MMNNIILKDINNLIEESEGEGGLKYYNNLPRGEYTPFSPEQQIRALQGITITLQGLHSIIKNKIKSPP